MSRSVPTSKSALIDEADPPAPAADGEPAQPGADEARIELAEEHLVVGKATKETGRVVVRTRTHETTETVEETLRHEEVDIERVPIGRVVTEAEGPRQEGDTWIVPVYEERLVVRRELVLTEELHVRRERRDEVVRQSVPLRRQEAVVTRTATDGAEPPDHPRPPGASP